MSLSRKEVRKIVGFTFLNESSNPENWYSRACSFNEAAKLLEGNSEGSIASTYYYNAGLSIELILKAIALAKSKSLNTIHSLVKLANIAEVSFTPDQESTLELLSEIIVWSGRYPSPKNEDYWNNYYDTILEKHIIREKTDATHATIINQNCFPTLENYLNIWFITKAEYLSVTAKAV